MASPTPSAGELRHRVTFQYRKTNEPDDMGVAETDAWFSLSPSVAAKIDAASGSEVVLSERMTGLGVFTITVRASSVTKVITANNRIVDARNTALHYDIKHVAQDARGRFITFTCERGGNA